MLLEADATSFLRTISSKEDGLSKSKSGFNKKLSSDELIGTRCTVQEFFLKLPKTSVYQVARNDALPDYFLSSWR